MYTVEDFMLFVLTLFSNQDQGNYSFRTFILNGHLSLIIPHLEKYHQFGTATYVDFFFIKASFFLDEQGFFIIWKVGY